MDPAESTACKHIISGLTTLRDKQLEIYSLEMLILFVSGFICMINVSIVNCNSYKLLYKLFKRTLFPKLLN